VEELRPSERMFETSDTLSIGLKAPGKKNKINSLNNIIVEPLDVPARMFGAELDDGYNQGNDETEGFAAEYVASTDDAFYDIGQEELDFIYNNMYEQFTV